MIPVILIGLALFSLALITDHPRRDFDKTSWDSDPDKRFEMIDDLNYDDALIGKSRSEVEQLLGPCDFHQDSSICPYYIGWLPWFITMDPSSLVLQFENDTVSNVFTMQH